MSRTLQPTPIDTRRDRRIALALAGLMMVVSAAALVGLSLWPEGPGKPVAVVFAPSATPEAGFRAVAAAGGTIVREGAFRNIIVAVSDDPGFHARLIRQGAWMLIDPKGLGGCFAPDTRT